MTAAVRAAAGGAGGAIAWKLVSLALPAAPEAVRFVVGFAVLAVGPGLALARFVPPRVDALAYWILAAGSGLAVTPILGHAMGTVGLLGWFPYVAAALGVAMLALPGPRRVRPRGRDLAAALAVASLAVALGATAYAGRLVRHGDTMTVHGEYDSFDTTYYAAVSSAVAYRIPPMSPYHSGHRLNYSYYPQLVLGLVARFAGVPLLQLYFTYAWTAFLLVAALGLFVLTRELTSSVRAAVLACVLFMVGSDVSYLIGWFGRPDTYLWDHLVWSTNLFSPSAETLYFNTFTPAMAIVFTGLTAMAAVEREHARIWTVMAVLCFASLAGVKPFAFAVILAGLGAAAVMPGAGRNARLRYVATGAAAVLIALPFLYQVLTAYGESHSKLVIRFFVMPATVLDKLALYAPLRAKAEAIGLAGNVAHAAVIAAGTVIFFLGGLGVRLIGVPEVWRRLRSHDPSWRLTALCAVCGAAIPFVIATEPYHQTLHFYQTTLFLMPIFVAAAVARLRGRLRIVAAVAVVALAVPSTIHYLSMKRTDAARPMLVAQRGDFAIASYLSRQPRESTVVLHDRPESPSLIAIMSGRAVVLGWSRYVVGSAPLVTGIRRFFQSATGDPRAAVQLLGDHAVTHVIEYRDRNQIHPDVLRQLRLVFRYGDIALYETLRP